MTLTRRLPLSQTKSIPFESPKRPKAVLNVAAVACPPSPPYVEIGFAPAMVDIRPEEAFNILTVFMSEI
jgi:hypothetical protein